MTKNSGMADAEIQFISGHSRRETLAIYQHVAVDGQLADKYQEAMKEVGTVRAVSMRRHHGVVVGRFPVRSKEQCASKRSRSP